MTFYTFANATTSIPLANLDANFATPITLGNTAVTINGTFSSIGNLTLNNATIASGNATVTKITAPTHDAGSGNALTLQSNSTTGLYIDTSQNVGIGTTSPSSYGKLAVYGASGVISSRIVSGGGTVSDYAQQILVAGSSFNYNINMQVYGDGSGAYHLSSVPFNFGTSSSNPLIFLTNNSERMRIDSSGNVGIGTSSPSTKLAVNGTSTLNGRVAINGTLRNAAYNGANQFFGDLNASGILEIVGTTTGTAGALIGFTNNNSTAVGAISTNGTGVTYGSLSDYRLKQNVTSMTNGLATIGALKPVTYDWISNKSQGEGFIAHELQAIIPAAVVGEKDAIDKDGNPIYQNVDYSKIVVHLVAAIQEQQATITALTSRIAALEAK